MTCPLSAGNQSVGVPEGAELRGCFHHETSTAPLADCAAVRSDSSAQRLSSFRPLSRSISNSRSSSVSLSINGNLKAEASSAPSVDLPLAGNPVTTTNTVKASYRAT